MWWNRFSVAHDGRAPRTASFLKKNCIGKCKKWLQERTQACVHGIWLSQGGSCLIPWKILAGIEAILCLTCLNQRKTPLMSTLALVVQLKAAMDGLLSASIQNPADPAHPLSQVSIPHSVGFPSDPSLPSRLRTHHHLTQAEQERLAGEVAEAARRLDMAFEQAKLSVNRDTAESVSILLPNNYGVVGKHTHARTHTHTHTHTHTQLFFPL